MTSEDEHATIESIQNEIEETKTKKQVRLAVEQLHTA